MKRITVSDIMAAEPCHEYSRERVEELWAGRETLDATEIAALDIPVGDRLWAVISCCLDDQQRQLFAYDCPEAALALITTPDHRSIEAIRISRLYATGEATYEKLAAIWYAAWYAARAVAVWYSAAWGGAMDSAMGPQLANAVAYAMEEKP